MIKQQVVIVLNEREQQKRAAALALQEELERRAIIADRVPVTENLVAELTLRTPRVIVLDYLLGDLTTGIDIVTALKEMQLEQTQFFFLTDETSTGVAVAAMKAGASDFLNIHSPQSNPSLLQQIETVIQQQTLPVRMKIDPLSKLVSNSPATKQLEAQIALAKKCVPVTTLVSGPVGSGVSYCLNVLKHTFHTYHWKHISLATDPIPTETIKTLLHADSAPKIAICIDDFEFDDGTITRILNDRARSKRAGLPPLLIGAHEPETVQALHTLYKPHCITVPPLSQRLQDIDELIDIFLIEADFPKQKLFTLTETDHAWLATQHWPGNVRQFRTVLYESLLTNPTSREDFQAAVRVANESTNACNTQAATSAEGYSPLKLLHTLERSHFSLRITAAKLGLTVPALQAALDRFQGEAS